jgi:hypothetical protein
MTDFVVTCSVDISPGIAESETHFHYQRRVRRHADVISNQIKPLAAAAVLPRGSACHALRYAHASRTIGVPYLSWCRVCVGAST